MAVIVKSIHSALQNAIKISFSVPIPTNSHLDLLGIKPEKSKKLSKILITSISDFFSVKKKVGSSP